MDGKKLLPKYASTAVQDRLLARFANTLLDLEPELQGLSESQWDETVRDACRREAWAAPAPREDLPRLTALMTA